MSAETLLRELDELGIQITIREGRLYCPAPRQAVPATVQKALSERKDQLLVLVQQDLEREKRKWVVTPDGLAKISDFFPNDRVGIVLRSDILSKPAGEVPIRFCNIRHIRPATSLDDLIFCEPPKDPEERKWKTQAIWQFEKVAVPRLDGEGVDEWVVGTRVGKPREYTFWAAGSALQGSNVTEGANE